MKKLVLMILWGWTSLAAGSDWESASPGWRYEFPRDHFLHAHFKTEWWYFTGNLFDEKERRLGFELTFFREGIIPPAQRDPARSRFVVNDLKFAHFTVTDAAGRKFRFAQKAGRGSFGEAGFDYDHRVAWVEDWTLELTPSGAFHLQAATSSAAIDFILTPRKTPVVHGQKGVSLKANEPGHASHYYSISRLQTEGSFRCENLSTRIHGESWFDHEWATNQLAENEAGWNWLCAQFRDGSELMLYQMRLRDGSIDSSSSGTYIGADGSTRFLGATEFSFRPTRVWKGAGQANYPVAWKVSVPKLQLEFAVSPVLDNQEVALLPIAYWEGAVDLKGSNVQGVGYLELTGYGAPLRVLSR